MPRSTFPSRRLAALLLLGSCAPSLRFGEPKPVGAADLVLPPNYQGAVVIRYRRPAGQAAQRIDGRRVYRVPADGLLEVREARQLLDDTLAIRVLGAAGDSLHLLGSCRLHRRVVRGASAKQVAGCWPPAYEGVRGTRQDTVSYDAIVVADSAHLAEAYNAAGRIITERLFGQGDAAFRWAEPRGAP